MNVHRPTLLAVTLVAATFQGGCGFVPKALSTGLPPSLGADKQIPLITASVPAPAPTRVWTRQTALHACKDLKLSVGLAGQDFVVKAIQHAQIPPQSVRELCKAGQGLDARAAADAKHVADVKAREAVLKAMTKQGQDDFNASIADFEALKAKHAASFGRAD
jgi:hypothetical protein